MSKELIPGLEFAKEFDLTRKEIVVLIPFLTKPYTTTEIAEHLNMNKMSMHHTISRLKLRRLLVLKDTDAKGNNLYVFFKNIVIPQDSGGTATT